MQKLDAKQATEALHALPLWTLDAQAAAITREFVLSDFIQAFAFMTQIAIAAEKHNHHPEWSNVYNKVLITWTTHDVHGLSANDMAMACLCDQAFAGYAATAAGH
ncbi:MAG: 4a-hydroxytetrahydrobiopterin dehydratase [Rhodoferax sp.]|nr:4a-hydroxytetrahydrobiopterin dehydratase [Rhodoferax sp.]